MEKIDSTRSSQGLGITEEEKVGKSRRPRQWGTLRKLVSGDSRAAQCMNLQQFQHYTQDGGRANLSRKVEMVHESLLPASQGVTGYC